MLEKHLFSMLCTCEIMFSSLQQFQVKKMSVTSPACLGKASRHVVTVTAQVHACVKKPTTRETSKLSSRAGAASSVLLRAVTVLRSALRRGLASRHAPRAGPPANSLGASTGSMRARGPAVRGHEQGSMRARGPAVQRPWSRALPALCSARYGPPPTPGCCKQRSRQTLE